VSFYLAWLQFLFLRPSRLHSSRIAHHRIGSICFDSGRFHSIPLESTQFNSSQTSDRISLIQCPTFVDYIVSTQLSSCHNILLIIIDIIFRSQFRSNFRPHVLSNVLKYSDLLSNTFFHIQS
jgi:hypothetical protein